MSDESPEEHEFSPEAPAAGGSRRRWLPIVLSGVVVVVVALTATALSGVFTADKDKSGKVEISGTDLPPIDPDMRYAFEDLEDGDNSEPSETSAAYREAFWGHLDKQFPGYQNHAIVEPEFENPKGDAMLGRKVEGADVVRTMSGLAEWKYDNGDKTSSTFNRNTGYKRPYFQLSGTAANNLPDYTQFPDHKFADGLTLRVYPAKSFTPGFSCDTPGRQLQIMHCCKSDSKASKCDTDTTGDGDQVMTHKRIEKIKDDGKKVKNSQTNTVALIRKSDGVGIMVSDESPVNRNEDDPSGERALDDPDDATPALSMDELIDLAKTLPTRPVK